jgi:hypothetical protein
MAAFFHNLFNFLAKKTLPFLAVFITGILLLSFSSLAGGPSSGVLDKEHPRVKETIKIQEEATPSLMSSEDILGTATGLDENGEVAIIVYVNQHGKGMAHAVRGLPGHIKGKPVVVEITEPFRSLVAKASKKPGGGGGVSHTVRQTPPIQLGTSGGWGYDLANGYCCGGTLGALIQIGGTQYLLSNYHVLASDSISGGNNRVATGGDPIIQPGLIDAGCNAGNAQNVASLYSNWSLPFANVDAAIAAATPGMVRTDGSILEIGTLSAQTVRASINQQVKKSGRTTGLTGSTVSAINATVSVAYDNECAGSTAFTKTFTGQIITKNSGSSFLAAGDSGSLMVENKSTNPRAVGLLFAGSSTLAVANPIGDVLSYFGAAMVGQ